MQAAKKQKTSNGKAKSGPGSVTLTFSVKDGVGVLEEALVVFKKNKINLTRIESRMASSPEWDYDFLVSFNGEVSDKLKKEFSTERWGNLRIFHEDADGGAAADAKAGSVWFPHKIQDLDMFASRVLDAGAELQSDHPGFQDPVYRKRRTMIVQLAKDHKHGEPLPMVEYTPAEVKTWGVVYEKLTAMFPTHACESFNRIFPLLEKNCGYAKDNIPQLRDISRFLKQSTGFTLRPVPGLLSPRDFLNGLAFRVFHSTQYLRHETKPLYTPEPDICHELLGHVPLFADPDFAAFSQEIGLASLGASDEFISQLSTCYWFTVEFGLCKEHGNLKAYGAGLLSSFGELEYCLSDKPKLLPFDPFVTGKTEYPITTFQPTYFVTESFADAMLKMRAFAQHSDRPYGVRYNPYTESIEVLDTAEKLGTQFSNLEEELKALGRSVRTLVKAKEEGGK